MRTKAPSVNQIFFSELKIYKIYKEGSLFIVEAGTTEEKK